MERVNAVEKKGEKVVRLPPGFRFHPTDEELVEHYLRRKSLSCPLPASIISDFHHVSNSDPWLLPGESGQERYFFGTRESKYPNGKKSNRATVSGYWKATGKDKPILSTRTTQLVGMKKTLVFYMGNPPRGSRTPWIMHEFRLVPNTDNSPPNSGVAVMGDWVLCRIFLKRRNAGGGNRDEEDEETGMAECCEGQNEGNGRPILFNFMARQRADLNLNASPCSSSSGSSGITEAFCNYKDDNNADVHDNINYNKSGSDEEHEEESSSCNSFSS